MSKYVKIEDTDILLIDGDRGNNYPSKKDFFPKGYCLFLDAGNITKNGFDFSKVHFITREKDNKLRNGKIQRNDIIMMTRGSVGNIALYDENVQYKNIRINSGMIIIRAQNDFSSLQLYYMLKSEFVQEQIMAMMSGSVQKQLPVSIINKINLIKKRIDVNIIKKLDDKIQNNNKIISELEKIAKTIYDYWFLQYEFPNEEGKSYKHSGGKMIYNEEVKKEIPEGWKCKKIEEIEDNIVTGKTPSTRDEENFNGSIPFITIDDIRQGLYISSTVRTLSEKGANSQIQKYIPKDSICVTCIATVGLVGITTKDSQTNQQINSIICKNKNNLYYLVNAIKEYFESSSGAKSGNIFDNMNKEDFASIKLMYPTKNILAKYHEKVETIYKKIKNCVIENEELIKLRDFLLPLLMNGQVGFKN